MNKKLFDKWLRALRSGKYNKGRGRLYNERTDRYCCLGVLAIMDGNTKEIIVNRIDYGYNCGLNEEHRDNLIEINDAKHNYGFTKVLDYLVKNRKEIVK